MLTLLLFFSVCVNTASPRWRWTRQRSSRNSITDRTLRLLAYITAISGISSLRGPSSSLGLCSSQMLSSHICSSRLYSSHSWLDTRNPWNDEQRPNHKRFIRTEVPKIYTIQHRKIEDLKYILKIRTINDKEYWGLQQISHRILTVIRTDSGVQHIWEIIEEPNSSIKTLSLLNDLQEVRKQKQYCAGGGPNFCSTVPL